MLSTALPYVSALFAIAALGVSLVAMQFALTNKRSDRDYRNLLLHLVELEDDFEALSASHKRLRSRVGMRELRKRRASKENGDDRADESPEDFKKRMREKLHRGELKVR